MNPLVTAEWLAAHMNEVRVVDASWHMPADKRDAKAEFEVAHIPGAVFFDLDAISDRQNPLPHMLPDAANFSASMQELGIGDGDAVVVYSTGLFSAPRAWWMLRAFGHDNARVLDGGFTKWQAGGHPTESGPGRPKPAHFSGQLKSPMVRDFAQVKATLDKTQILDARSAPRFAGSAPEPRPGLKSGHMPGACNLPFQELLNADKTMKDEKELRQVFAARNVDLNAPIITTCGSGVTAAVISLALARLGAPEVSLYDGSWSEWGGRDDAPIATGE